jgi:CheY-like chemotaxis protein
MCPGTVLLIDDDPDALTLLKDSLEDHNYNCITALSPDEGISKIREMQPQLVVLDLMLPQMSGYGVLREIKGRKETAKIPVVVLTAIKDDEVLDEARALGANVALSKSPDLNELILSVRQYL